MARLPLLEQVVLECAPGGGRHVAERAAPWRVARGHRPAPRELEFYPPPRRLEERTVTVTGRQPQHRQVRRRQRGASSVSRSSRLQEPHGDIPLMLRHGLRIECPTPPPRSRPSPRPRTPAPTVRVRSVREECDPTVSSRARGAASRRSRCTTRPLLEVLPAPPPRPSSVAMARGGPRCPVLRIVEVWRSSRSRDGVACCAGVVGLLQRPQPSDVALPRALRALESITRSLISPSSVRVAGDLTFGPASRTSRLSSWQEPLDRGGVGCSCTRPRSHRAPPASGDLLVGYIIRCSRPSGLGLPRRAPHDVAIAVELDFGSSSPPRSRSHRRARPSSPSRPPSYSGSRPLGRGLGP